MQTSRQSCETIQNICKHDIEPGDNSKHIYLLFLCLEHTDPILVLVFDLYSHPVMVLLFLFSLFHFNVYDGVKKTMSNVYLGTIVNLVPT
jgi:hypothetical protein